MEDFLSYCTLICIGWTSQSGFCISSFSDYRCLQHKAPQYLLNQSLRLSVDSICDLPLVISFISTFGHRTFAVADPKFWNSLADELRTYSSDGFKAVLKKLFGSPITDVSSAGSA